MKHLDLLAYAFALAGLVVAVCNYNGCALVSPEGAAEFYSEAAR
jgi:hypothetical protein